MQLRNSSAIAAVRSFNTILAYVNFVPQDPFVAYLPLAHVMEFVIEHMLIMLGIPIGYSLVDIRQYAFG